MEAAGTGSALDESRGDPVRPLIAGVSPNLARDLSPRRMQDSPRSHSCGGSSGVGAGLLPRKAVGCILALLVHG